MTEGNHKLRALILAALMVLSVFAGTVALSGTAGAAANATLQSAIEYQDPTNPGNDGDGGEIELAFSSSVTVNNVTVYNESGATLTPTTAVGATGSRVVIPDSAHGNGDLQPSQDIIIQVGYEDGAGESVVNESVVITASNLRGDQTDSQVAYQGAPIAYVVDGGTDVGFDIYEGGTFFAGRSTNTNSEVFVFDSTGASTSSTWFFNNSGTVSDLELRNLGLGVEADNVNLTTNDDITGEVTSRQSNRDVNVELYRSGNLVDKQKGVFIDGDGAVDYSFGSAGDYGAGSYTVKVVDQQTGNTVSTEEITVEQVTADAEFGTSVVTQERGDIAMITILLSGGATSGNFTLGGDDVNFELNGSFVDNNGDGQVTIVWNTEQSTNAEGGVDSLADSSDTVTVRQPIVDSVDNPVEPGEYPISVDVTGEGNAEDLGTVIVEERADTDLTTHTAPGGMNYTAASSAEQGNTIAVGGFPVTDSTTADEIIIRLAASGIEGAIQGDADNLNATNVPEYELVIVEDSSTVGVNEEALTLTMDDPAVELVNPEEDVYFVQISADALEGAEEGDQFNVYWDSDGTNTAAAADAELTASFQLVRGEVTFDRQANKVFVDASEDAQVTGESSWAPGTELQVRLKASGGTSPFVKTNDSIVVTEEGTWTGTFDLSDQADGQSFQASILATNGETDVPGEIGTLNAAVTFDDQNAEDAGTKVTIDSVTLSNGGFVAIHRESASGPVVGVSQYLEAGSHSDVTIRLEEAITSETTLVAMAHKDTDQDKTFDWVASEGEDDGPYTSGGAAVTDDATVAIPTPTPSPTEPPTDTPTDTPTEMDDTPTESDGDDTPTPTPTPTTTPGFGLIVALLALAGAALLALRRD